MKQSFSTYIYLYFLEQTKTTELIDSFLGHCTKNPDGADSSSEPRFIFGISRELSDRRSHGSRARKTPTPSEGQENARLRFAKTYLAMPTALWENILRTDKLKLELFGKTCHLRVYRDKIKSSKKTAPSLGTNTEEVPS